MPIRLRLALVFGLLGLVTVATVSSIAYVMSAQEVRGSVDDQLVQRLSPLAGGVGDGPFADLEPDGGPVTGEQALETARAFLEDPSILESEGDTTSIRILWSDGTYTGGPDEAPSEQALDALPTVIDGAEPAAHFESTTIDGSPYRIMTAGTANDDVPIIDGRQPIGVQLYRDVTAEEAALDQLATRLTLMSLVAALVVGGAGLVVGRWLARPITELSETAEELAELEDLPRRVEIRRNDELGHMADSYNRLLSAIEVGREQQQRLVADASHELRTPLTGLRMRLEYLQRDDIAPDRRSDLLTAAVDDAEQLSELASDLVDLAAATRTTEEDLEEQRLLELVDDVAERVRRRTERDIVVTGDDTVAVVRPTMIRRAVHNLVDNALKYADTGPIEITSTRGRIEVRDHGAGIGDDDLAHVFDRFFRSPKARTRPGNGIGLAIVRQVADAHDGQVWVHHAPDGGAIVGFSVEVTHDR